MLGMDWHHRYDDNQKKIGAPGHRGMLTADPTKAGVPAKWFPPLPPEPEFGQAGCVCRAAGDFGRLAEALSAFGGAGPSTNEGVGDASRSPNPFSGFGQTVARVLASSISLGVENVVKAETSP